jgi:hypothetical protein
MPWLTTQAAVSHTVTHGYHVAWILLVVGGFLLLAAATMALRASTAKTAGLPEPSPPHTDFVGKITSAVAEMERSSAPLYRAMAWLLLVVSAGLLIASFVVYLLA